MIETASPLTIGTIAKRAGVGVETVRFYERKGLIARPRRPLRGFRSYSPETVQRIRFVRQAQALGFTLREIKGLLSLRADPKTDCSDIRRRSQEKLADVIAKIRQLDEIRRSLEKLIAACPGRGAIRACGILDGLADSKATSDRQKLERIDRRGRSKMKTYIISIEGMHCEGCVSTVQALLEMEAGVQAAKVSLKEKTARVLVKSGDQKPERLMAAIERAGYRTTLRAP